jgi:serine/threonine-protein kinase
MATVFEVIDRASESETHLALKLATSDPSIRETSYSHLESEFKVIQRIHSPHTIKVFNSGIGSTGAPFFTMELISGETLDAVLRSRTKEHWFTASEIVSLLTKIAEGVDAVHQAGLVYADLKPSNIIVSERSDEPQVKLIDFGITCSSIPYTSDPELNVSTSSGLTGTSLFMSPEQVRGLPLTVRSDIYSFGILAFLLCTGELPFGGEGIFSVTASHLLGKVPPLRTLNPKIPRSLERVILVALEKLPGDRYSSMSEINERLRQVSGDDHPFSRFFKLFG